MTAFKVKCMTVKGYSLVNIRLCFYSLAFLHLLVTAIVTLTIDLTQDEDPKVRMYSRIRWSLLTCWFNMVTLFYLPLCIYCELRVKIGDDSESLGKLIQIRDVIMTAICSPVTIFSDIVFWTIFNWNPNIIAPVQVFEYLPLWSQHSLHTISLLFVIMDLVLTPRQRPKSDKTRLAVLIGFLLIYTLVAYVNFTRGETVYAFFENASRAASISITVISVLIIIVCYYIQWFVISFVWDNTDKQSNKYLKVT